VLLRVDPPVIRREPTAGLVVKGRPMELSCEADGNPPVIYDWFKVFTSPLCAHSVAMQCITVLNKRYHRIDSKFDDKCRLPNIKCTKIFQKQNMSSSPAPCSKTPSLVFPIFVRS